MLPTLVATIGSFPTGSPPTRSSLLNELVVPLQQPNETLHYQRPPFVPCLLTGLLGQSDGLCPVLEGVPPERRTRTPVPLLGTKSTHSQSSVPAITVYHDKADLLAGSAECQMSAPTVQIPELGQPLQCESPKTNPSVQATAKASLY